MMKPYPTYRQREVLQFLMSGNWVPILRLIPVGEKLLGNLVKAGWIERSTDVKKNDLYRITEAGRSAFRTPVPIK
jgi:predicted transcriptional regulator